MQSDLFDPQPLPQPPAVSPWRPRPCGADQWPPDYAGVFAWRIDMLEKLRANPNDFASAEKYYSTRPAEWIMDWCDTFDPRKQSMKWMPFVMFPRQVDYIDFLEDLRRDNESGLVEKCRDAGVSWLSIAYTAWSLRFIRGDSTGWGSRKQDLVDKLGDMDSLFEKLRVLINRLPDIWQPKDWKTGLMKVVNNDNGASATGESGDGIGRGGRKAQPVDSPVLTPSGWRRIGDLEVGDAVCSPDGGTTTVVGIQDHGRRPAFHVRLSDGSSTFCDADHLWRVTDKLTRKNLLRSKKIRGVDHRILTTSEVAATIKHGREWNWSIPITQPLKLSGETCSDLPIHPYVMGVVLGDGCVTRLEKTNATMVSFDQEIVDRVRECLGSETILVERRKHGNFSFNDALGRQGRGHKSKFKQSLFDLGVANKNALNKSIPDRYKFASIDARVELLRGLMDTDGYVSGRKGAGKVCISLSSRALIEDVRFIVQSLGGTVGITTRVTSCADTHTLTMNLPEFNPFHLRRKAERVGIRVKYHPRRFIIGIELSGDAEMRCITVSNPDGLYLVDECIVTHNSRYFVDESAHVERPETIEASLGDNTRVRVDISSVNGTGNPFHRKREAGIIWERGAELPKARTRVFIFDWRDHPEKTQEWYDLRKAQYEAQGMAHVFAQEVERNYSAAVEGIIIQPEWILACVDAHLKVPALMQAFHGDWMAGLDIADEGQDKNALAVRQGVILRHISEWGDRDPGVTTRRMLGNLREMGRTGLPVQYDCIGIGSAVRSEYNSLCDRGEVHQSEFEMVAWHAGASVTEPFGRLVPDDPKSPTNGQFFHNMKAQAWWSMRTRCYKTWKAVTQGVEYDADELMSIDSSMGYDMLEKVKMELAQATKKQTAGSLKLVVNKTPKGTKSPNTADATVMAFFPAPETGATAEIGVYGG